MRPQFCNLNSLINLLILTNVIIYFNACNNKPSNQSKVESKPQLNNDFTKTFEGNINNKYVISMTLIKSANALNGTYNYKGKNTSMKLVGSIDNNGNITLNEFNGKGNITGNFKGQLTGKNFNGIWSKPDGSNSLGFYLTEISGYRNNESSNSKNSVNRNQFLFDSVYSNSNYSETGFYGSNDWIGFYVDNYGQTLEIREGDYEDEFIFRLTPNTSEECTEGPVDGLGKIESNGNGLTAFYYDSNMERSDQDYGICEIKFRMKNSGRKEIHTEDKNCMYGAPCGGFSSVFKKR